MNIYCAIIVILLNSHLIKASMTLRRRNFPNRRIKRSGGYPKFPTTDESAQPIQLPFLDDPGIIVPINGKECGKRSVTFNPQRNPKIVGGTVAPYGAFPWQVEIQMFHYERKMFEHHCGGAVVGEHLIVTAAHCTEVPQQQYLRLVIGNHDLVKRDLYEHSYRVDRILVHPEFRHDGPYSNDIAIIRVKSNSALGGIHFNTHVKPICLPPISIPIGFPGTWCSVTGWGAQNDKDLKNPAPILRAAAVPLLDQTTCRMADVNGGRQQPILDTMLCAGFLQGGIDACGGDSGGPLACEYENRFFLAGLVSWGDGCAKKNRPGVYTRVESYSQWILETIEKLE